MQLPGQIEGKLKLSMKAKATFDAVTGLMKWYEGKSNEKITGGKMYRISCNGLFIQNCWGTSKMDVHQFLKHHLPASMFKQGLHIQPLV